MDKFCGTLEQLLWFDGLSKASKHRIYTALASDKYQLLLNSETLEGVLVRI